MISICGYSVSSLASLSASSFLLMFVCALTFLMVMLCGEFLTVCMMCAIRSLSWWFFWEEGCWMWFCMR